MKDDQRTVLRLCLGAELGAGAEIDYIFGFTDASKTEEMLCGSVFADVDIVLLAAAGAAVGCGTLPACLLPWWCTVARATSCKMVAKGVCSRYQKRG